MIITVEGNRAASAKCYPPDHLRCDWRYEGLGLLGLVGGHLKNVVEQVCLLYQGRAAANLALVLGQFQGTQISWLSPFENSGQRISPISPQLGEKGNAIGMSHQRPAFWWAGAWSNILFVGCLWRCKGINESEPHQKLRTQFPCSLHDLFFLSIVK